VTAATHVRDRGLDADERRLQIHVEQGVPVRRGRRRHRRTGERGGVVDEDVEAAERPRGGSHEPARRTIVTQIRVQGEGPPTAPLQVAHGCARGHGRAVIPDHDVEAGVSQAKRDLAPEPNGAAGHERASPRLGFAVPHVIFEAVMKTWLKVRLIAGFFVTVPAVATAWILWAFWSWIDDRFAPIYERMLGRAVPGLGFLTAVVLMLSMGIVARNVVGRRVLAFGDSWLHRVPVFRLLYPSVKMLIDSFSPERRSSFKAVVLVQHPREGTYAFGFVTSQVLLEAPAGKGEMVTVFVPSNNLYLGDIIMVPDEDIIHTGLSVEEGIRIILSAGTATPPRLPRI
jgi:uncharacterized membrane protein